MLRDYQEDLLTKLFRAYNDGFTDDASVVESYGHTITLVEGNRENIKITTPYDIVVAEAILNYPLSIIH